MNTVDDATLRARRYLLRAGGPWPSKALVELIAERGPVAAVEAIDRRDPEGDGIMLSLAPVRQAQLDHEQGLLDKGTCRLLTPEHEDWPFPTNEIGNGYAAPVALWTVGNGTLPTPHTPSVAIVGSREASEHGVAAATEWAGYLGTRGATVVSGGARGIDAAAHLGTLGAGATTIAVLAHGIEQRHPLVNTPIFNRIANEGGLLITAFPPKSPAIGWHFPVRNRLIVALAQPLLVVEASTGGGTIRATDEARRIGRQVLYVPHRGPGLESPGVAAMRRHNLARPVMSPEEIIPFMSDPTKAGEPR